MEAKDSWAFEFTLAEIVEMENMYKEIGEKSLNQESCQDLATSFSSSFNRFGKPAIPWEQVQSWFQDKQKELQAKEVQDKQKELQANDTSSPMALKLCVDLSDATTSRNEPESLQKPRDTPLYQRNKISELSELQFEAKSSRDNAWYDVASFLSYRVLCTGELEARVRFSGFRNTDDEWVNVKEGVRQRSIPLEPSECHRVKVGDLVLCFQEREDQAVHCDAHVVEIHRRLHDIRGCRCIFVVRYDHDNAEEKVQLSRLCCRPKPLDVSGHPTIKAGGAWGSK